MQWLWWLFWAAVFGYEQRKALLDRDTPSAR